MSVESAWDEELASASAVLERDHEKHIASRPTHGAMYVTAAESDLETGRRYHEAGGEKVRDYFVARAQVHATLAVALRA